MTSVEPRKLRAGEFKHSDCVWIQHAFMRGLSSLVEENISWKLSSMADLLDVEVDWEGTGRYRVGIRCGQKLIATCIYQEGGDVEVGDLLRKNLAIVCAVHQAEVEKWCPNSVAGVEATRDTEGWINLVIKFKNGHWFRAAERDADKPEFKAHCIMLYDLPTL